MKKTIIIPAVEETKKEISICDVCGREIGVHMRTTCYICGKELCGSFSCTSFLQWPNNTGDSYDFVTCKEHFSKLDTALQNAYDRYNELIENIPGYDELLKEELEKDNG